MSPVEVRQFEGLTYVAWSRLPAAPPGPPVDRPGEVDDRVVEVDHRVVEVDPLSAHLAEVVAAAHVDGRPVGRRTVARELGVTEYRAGQLLARTNGSGRGTA